nr:BTAD domain-containing putative transcriptional regulator [Gordonia sp. SID5947]
MSVTAADGTLIPMTARKHAELLTILTVERSPCSPERIADALWRGHPPRSAAGTLQGYISRLRKQLAPTGSVRIDTEPAGYVLRCDGAATDLDLLDKLAQEGLQALRSDPAAGAELLCRALDLWRGDPLVEIADIADYEPELVRLDAMRSDLVESAAEAFRALGEHRRAIAMLTPMRTRHPYREGAARTLARALRDDGRTVDAIDTLRRLRRTLSVELGLDPSADTVALEAELLAPARVPAGDRSTAPVSGRPALIGRTSEAAVLDRVWDAGTARPAGALVFGASGIGKTALAEDLVARHLAIARRFIGRPIGDARAFAAIDELFGRRTEAIGVSAVADDMSAQIWSDIHAHGRSVFLLDDVQHLDVDSARLLARVWSGMPRAAVTVVVTGRSPEDPCAQIISAALRRHGLVTELTLGELATAEIRLVVDRRFENLGVTPMVDRDELAAHGFGNPLIANQICDAVALGATPDLRHPVRTAVAARLDELSTEGETLMRILAASGGRVRPRVLAELACARPATVDELRSLGLAEVSADGTLCVPHDRVREAALARASRSERISAHAVIAAALETACPEDRESIAVHRAESADDHHSAAYAARCCRDAAQRALDSDADHRALELARRGLAVGPDDDGLVVDLNRIAGSAATRIGDFDTATEAFESAARVSRHRRDWSALADTALLSSPQGVAGYWSGFGVVQSTHPPLVREALAHSEELDARVAARLRAGEAARLTVLGMPGAREQLAAAQLATGSDAAVDYEITLADFLLRWEPTTLEERRTIAGALETLSGGDVLRRATALHLQRVCALEAGDLRLTRRLSHEFARSVGSRDGTDLHTMQLWWQVMLALLRGDYPASRALTERFAAIVGDLSERARMLAEASVATSRSIEAWHHGELASMLPEFDTLIDEVDDDFALVIALGSAEAGDHDRALRLATELTSDAASWSGSRVVARVPLLVETLFALSRSRDHAMAAREICRRLEHLVTHWSSGLIVQWPGLVCLGPAVLYRGTAASILGRDGTPDLREAVRVARDAGALPYEARARRRLDQLAGATA